MIYFKRIIIYVFKLFLILNKPAVHIIQMTVEDKRRESSSNVHVHFSDYRRTFTARKMCTAGIVCFKISYLLGAEIIFTFFKVIGDLVIFCVLKTLFLKFNYKMFFRYCSLIFPLEKLELKK